MTRRETVIQALNHKETEKLPWFVEFTGQECEKVAKALGDDHFIDRLRRQAELLGNDLYAKSIAKSYAGRGQTKDTGHSPDNAKRRRVYPCPHACDPERCARGKRTCYA